MFKRNVFVLSSNQDLVEFNRGDVRHEWNIHSAETLQQSCALIGMHDFFVGVIDFSHSSAKALLEWQEELMLLNPAIAWLALVPPHYLDDPQFRRQLIVKFFDYHTLPHDPLRLQVILGHAYGMALLHHHPADEVGSNGQCGMVGETDSMQQVFREIHKAAGVDYPVLITGESGTGKELVARAIHTSSPRSNRPFVAVNCAALPANLIQSELFGHTKGAFTGAHENKTGHIESAQGGTVFLDEIGDLSPEAQVVLLRFLQESVIQRVGSSQDIKLDVRVLTATHVDLERAVREGRFREDLYYRLNVLRATPPPLRDRRNDIAILAQHFLEKFKGNNGKVKGFSSQAIETLLSHDWPGNVRELINRIRRALVMSENRWLTPGDLGLERRAGRRGQVTDLNLARQLAEKQAILTALRQSGNNLSLAAKSLGISRMTLYRLMEKVGLECESLDRNNAVRRPRNNQKPTAR
ncbi:sigma-54 dependent transcriptional regulator [Methyloterricola oryzae]|uniref:sigma-54 dependent transcriptional regulator n=1 Tax=Methyloterricola oryzae TaxID=1495050 RepID=UPI0005EB5667|nr:sigma-54 dependent transcriptional regulator [Methyloterricola oryzae]